MEREETVILATAYPSETLRSVFVKLSELWDKESILKPVKCWCQDIYKANPLLETKLFETLKAIEVIRLFISNSEETILQ